MSYHSYADLGGQDVQDPVLPEPEGELFHASWEPRAMALTVAMGATGLWSIDKSRTARETLPGYRDLSYYEIWLAALEKLLLQSGAAHADELRQGRMLQPALPTQRVLHSTEVAAVLARGAPTARPAHSPARFALGQRIRAIGTAAAHHTRLPGYVRGKRGIIERIHGTHVFADVHAQGLGEQPQWLYTVAFDEKELWGVEAPRQGSSVSVDAWEPYLEPA